MLLFLSMLLTTWLQCYGTWPKIVNGKNISGSIDTSGFKPNFTWKINDFWLIFNRKLYVLFWNTALRNNQTVIKYPLFFRFSENTVGQKKKKKSSIYSVLCDFSFLVKRSLFCINGFYLSDTLHKQHIFFFSPSNHLDSCQLRNGTALSIGPN